MQSSQQLRANAEKHPGAAVQRSDAHRLPHAPRDARGARRTPGRGFAIQREAVCFAIRKSLSQGGPGPGVLGAAFKRIFTEQNKLSVCELSLLNFNCLELKQLNSPTARGVATCSQFSMCTRWCPCFVELVPTGQGAPSSYACRAPGHTSRPSHRRAGLGRGRHRPGSAPPGRSTHFILQNSNRHTCVPSTLLSQMISSLFLT